MPARKNPDSHDLLVQTALTVELLNTRLFGGAGQKGAIPYMYEQHEALTKNLNDNKQELLDKIDLKKQEVDESISALEEKHNKLDKKVNWYTGGVAAIGAGATLILGWLGLHAK